MLCEITPTLLAERIQQFLDREGACLIYVPAPWLGLNDYGQPAGVVRADTRDVLTLMRGATSQESFEVDLDEHGRLLTVTF